jgi:hypothetical protein
MQRNDSSNHQDSIQGWQVVGELELTPGLATDHTVSKWLQIILSLQELPADFAAKVLRSAQEATSRAIQAENIVKSQHIHLLVLVLADHKLNKQNWGFFRIEKIESEPERSYSDHTIEVYLYQEGG